MNDPLAIQPREIASQSVVMHDNFDTKAFQETYEIYPDLQKVVEQKVIPETPTFVEDVFSTFYKASPTLVPEEQLSRSAQIRRRMVEEMMLTSEYSEVRAAGTIQDEFSSAIATAAVSYGVMEKLDRKTKNRLKTLDQAEQEAARLFQQAGELESTASQLDGDDASAMYKQAQALRQQAEQIDAKADAEFAELDESAEQLEDVARRAAREALEKAQEEIEDTNNALATFAPRYSQGGVSQQTQMLNTAEKMRLAQRIVGNKKLARIAELAGKMVNTALYKQRVKVIHPPDEIIGVETGNDLAHLLPAELVKLADPDLEVLFYLQYMERSLLQYELIGHEPQAKGPIILCVDTSNSMTDSLTRSRDPEKRSISKEIWSKAVVFALLAIARRQRRDFACLYFSDYGDIETFRLPKGQAETNELIDMAECFFDGGTVYDDWMRESLKIAEESQYNNADIVVVSDGEVGISDQTRDDFNQRRAAKKMHSYGVLLEQPSPYGYRGLYGGQVLASVTDAMIQVGDLDQDAPALDMMFTI